MKLAAIGDNVIDLYASDRRGFVGGNCVNVAVYARRAGAEQAAYFGVVGDDRWGGDIISALDREGVETAGVRRRPGPTAWCEISHAEGDRSFVAKDKGVSLFSYDEEWDRQLGGFDVIHTAYSAGLEHAAARLSARGPLSFDFSDRHERDYVSRLAPYLSYAEFSGGDLDLAACRTLARSVNALGVPHVLVTRGAEGALYSAPDAEHVVGGERIDVVDTLGAGDTFIAAFLVGIADGRPVGDVLADATARAAHTCTTYGGFDAALELSSAP